MVESHEDGESEEVQINFRATQKQKQAWKEYAEEAGFKSFSEFLRVAVKREVEGEERGENTVPDTSEATTQTLAELMEKTQMANNQIEDLRDDVKLIKNEVREDEDLRSIKNEVFNQLPEKEDDFTEIDLSIGGKMESVGATVKTLSDTLNIKKDRVREALRMLMDETNLVTSIEVDGETRYFKEV